MKIRYYFITFMFIVSCNSSLDVHEKWKESIDYRKKTELMKSITCLKEIINHAGNDTMAVKAQYQIADIYLNDVNNYVFAIKEFEKVIENYSESDYSKKAMFMVGYINANYIHAYSDAIFYYNLFLKKYPSDELSYSVSYELELLDKVKEEIHILNQK